LPQHELPDKLQHNRRLRLPPRHRQQGKLPPAAVGAVQPRLVEVVSRMRTLNMRRPIRRRLLAANNFSA
jgi:hypothetical protein